MNYDKDILIKNINIIMKDNGISQGDLARITGTYQSRISECLKGKKDFTLQQIISIADYFKVSIDLLLGRQERTAQDFKCMTDLIKLFFTLSENTDSSLRYEDIGDEHFYFRESENKELVETLSDLSNYDLHDDGEGITTITTKKKNYYLSFTNKTLNKFFEEWYNAQKILNFTNGETLYNTWKNGILEKFKNNYKIYGYKTKTEYQYSLYKDFLISNHDFVISKYQNINFMSDEINNTDLKFPSSEFDCQLLQEFIEKIANY